MDDGLTGGGLTAALHDGLARLVVRAWRVVLGPADVEPTIPMLRGVWGAALRDVDRAVYDRVFEGKPGGTPGYLLRPGGAGGPVGAGGGFAFDFVLFGPPDARAERAAWAAWDDALARGLGAERRRARAAEVVRLTPAGPGAAGRDHPGFALAPLPWPGEVTAPCHLSFPTPLRLLREGKLIAAPAVPDLAVAGLRRFQALAPEAAAPSWTARGAWLEVARAVPAGPFVGGPLDLVRYSARQRSEVELRGVGGSLELPAGPGALAGLLAAAGWLHLGKSTAMGLGRVVVVPAAG